MFYCYTIVPSFMHTDVNSSSVSLTFCVLCDRFNKASFVCFFFGLFIFVFWVLLVHLFPWKDMLSKKLKDLYSAEILKESWCISTCVASVQKSWVFRWCLKVEIETGWILQMLMGSEFQICDAEILKARDSNDRLCRGITSWWESGECKHWLVIP